MGFRLGYVYGDSYLIGGNSGIGKEIVKALLNHNAKVYLAARNPESASTTIEELKKETGKEAFFLELNLASLKSVEKAAKDFLAKEHELHALFNNAWVANLPPQCKCSMMSFLPEVSCS